MPAHETENARQIACADIMPDCPFTASAATEEELLNKVAAHAEHEHWLFGLERLRPTLSINW